MDITTQTLLLAFGLGLLGFIEPCTIGAHMLFLGSQRSRPMSERLGAALIFLLARLVVMGGFGGLIVVLGQRLIGVQTGTWLVFGAIYLALGLAIFAGWSRQCGTVSRLHPNIGKQHRTRLFRVWRLGLTSPPVQHRFYLD